MSPEFISLLCLIIGAVVVFFFMHRRQAYLVDQITLRDGFIISVRDRLNDLRVNDPVHPSEDSHEILIRTMDNEIKGLVELTDVAIASFEREKIYHN